MHYLSIATRNTDPYRAGIEIGEGLCGLAPEVVLLFASFSYEPGFAEFFVGLKDALEGLEPLIIGGTGDGITEASIAANYGICALGISSDGAVAWSVGFRQGVHADSRGASRDAALEAAGGLAEPATFCFVMADGSQADGTAVVKGVRDAIALPFFGGLSGDDRRFTRSRVFYGWCDHEDAVVVLMGSGPLPFVLSAVSGWHPVGETGVVESASGCIVRTISGASARDFMTGQIGKPLGETDMGIVPLATFDADLDGRFYLRSPSGISEESGEVTVFGSIEEGAPVKVCAATREDVLSAIDQTVEGLLTPTPGFTPGAAILISCAGRKWLLEDKGSLELDAFIRALGVEIPLVGFPSFGEISPIRLADGSYTPPCFHNVTFVACLLGC